MLWEQGGEESKAAEHFVISAKLNPQNGTAFRYLGDYYARVSADSQRALKCYHRAVILNPDDSLAGEPFCDLLDQQGKLTLQFSVCSEASDKSPRAFWAFRRLGFLLVLSLNPPLLRPSFVLLPSPLPAFLICFLPFSGPSEEMVRSCAQTSACHPRLSHLCRSLGGLSNLLLFFSIQSTPLLH